MLALHPVSLLPGGPITRNANVPKFGDFVDSTEHTYSIAPTSAFEITTPVTPLPPPTLAQEKGKGKATSVEHRCIACGKSHSGKCRQSL